jgi:hypothetical protein
LRLPEEAQFVGRQLLALKSREILGLGPAFEYVVNMHLDAPVRQGATPEEAEPRPRLHGVFGVDTKQTFCFGGSDPARVFIGQQLYDALEPFGHSRRRKATLLALLKQFSGKRTQLVGGFSEDTHDGSLAETSKTGNASRPRIGDVTSR